ncbi:MAG TPA: DUF3040 domain-containing protein [Actinomycetota bacterium]|nr:DUF3040 domain-containing protein [Actinomycetota bacterium]
MAEESSLSEHEQRILQEIERSLAAEDPDIERRLRNAKSPHDAKRRLRLGILGFLIGLALLLGFAVNLAFGLAGFLVMLVSAVAIGASLRELGSAGSSQPGSFRDALKRAEGRMRPRRRDI